MRTAEEIHEMITKLKSEGIEANTASINVVKNNLSNNEIFDTYEDNDEYLTFALQAREWLDGKIDNLD